MKKIRKICYSAIHAIDCFNEWIGRTIAWLICIMVLITFLIVVLRYVFNLGWIAMQESVSYLHALVFMLGIAYTLKQEGHVRVDIFYQRCGEKFRSWIDFLGALTLLLPFCGYVLWSSWEYVETSWAIKETSPEAGGLPALYLIKTAIPVMAGLLLLQGTAQMLRSLIKIFSPPDRGVR